MEEKCLAEQKRAQHSRTILGMAEKTLGIAEKCLEEPKSAQKRRNAAQQSSNVHISELLYLWATVVHDQTGSRYIAELFYCINAVITFTELFFMQLKLSFAFLNISCYYIRLMF